MHSFVKLITKLLANRLAVKLHELVSPIRNAFIKGRFIQDNFMLVQQTTRFLHQQKHSRILLKLDSSKALDSVCWPFLLEVLREGMERHYQWDAPLFIHQSVVEWDSRISHST
jgi:hypothetical protein